MVKDMTNHNETDYVLPGKAESYWIATTPESSYPPISGDTHVDVAILGGGIVGITTAYLLKEAGVLSVAVIEADRIITGVTGHTTAVYCNRVQEMGYDHRYGCSHDSYRHDPWTV
jgi:hypothetical protein